MFFRTLLIAAVVLRAAGERNDVLCRDDVDGDCAHTFLLFVKDNIVGFVMIISAIVWIPICCAISNYDKAVKQRVRKLIKDNREARLSLMPTPSVTLSRVDTPPTGLT